MDGPIGSIDFGVQFDSRTKSRINSDEGFLDLASGELSQEFTPTGAVTIPFGLPAIATFDPVQMFARGTYRRVDNFHGNVLAGDWSVGEVVSLAYLRFGIDTMVGDTPLTGNLGVQVVRTDQSSIGSSARNAQGLSAEAVGQQSVSSGASYTDYLPILNLNFLVADGQFVRFGLARTLARARMDEMRASRSVNFNASLVNSTDPANGEGGVLSGLELSLQVAGEVLTQSLQGFGAVLNASFTHSEIERGTGDSSTPLPGLSDTVDSLTLYYEQGGFSARVSRNHRSDFLGEVQGFGSSRTLRFIAGENLVDAQVSYSFAEGGRWDGLTLYLQGTNLTNEPFTGFLNNDHRQVKDWQEYGATYFFGGSYRFQRNGVPVRSSPPEESTCICRG